MAIKTKFQELQECYNPAYKRLTRLASPLYRRFGIHGYRLFIVYSTGEWYFFSNNASCNRDHLAQQHENNMDRFYPIHALPSMLSAPRIIWDLMPASVNNKIDSDIADEYDYFHRYTMSYKIDTSKGLAIVCSHFLAPKDLQEINNFYVNESELLTRFNRYAFGEMKDYLHTLPPHVSPQSDAPIVSDMIKNSFKLKDSINEFLKDTHIHYPKYTECDNITLSARQKELMYWMLRGKSEAETAIILGLSPHTVRSYYVILKRKFRVNSKVELLLKLIDLGLIASDDWNKLQEFITRPF